jgi:hypothetical protein
MSEILVGTIVFLIAFAVCLYSIKTKRALDKAKKDFVDALKELTGKRRETYLTEQPNESTREVLKEMYPRPLTPEEAEKEMLDYFKNGPMPGVVTRRLKNGTIVTQHPFELEIPEGYEMAKLNTETVQFEYNDGTVEHHPSQMRKIQ